MVGAVIATVDGYTVAARRILGTLIRTRGPIFGLSIPHRLLAWLLLGLGLWEVTIQMHLVDIRPRTGWRGRGSVWLWNRMLGAQLLDNLHHAPCCPANNYHHRRLVTKPCTCGTKPCTCGTKRIQANRTPPFFQTRAMIASTAKSGPDRTEAAGP